MLAASAVFLFLFALIFLGIEIPITLAMATFFAVIVFKTPMDIGSIAQGAAAMLPNEVTLICVPLFVLTGSLISNSFIVSRLILVANTLVGKIKGGLAVVTIIASFLFGGISGSAAADCASIGGVLIPMMIKNGYPRDFAVSVTITASTLGPIVPPSIIMIVYGWQTNTSIAALFVAGYLPGALVALVLIGLTLYCAYKNNYPMAEETIGFRAATRILLGNLPIVLLPVAIIAGIVSGLFTPTEAGAFGALYSLAILVVYGGLKTLDVKKVLSEVASVTGICCFLLAFAGVFARFLTYTRAPSNVTDFLLPYVESPSVFLGLVTVIFLFLGCFMNPVAALIMTLPILYPVSQEFNVHPLHLGMVATVSLAMGHVTPPVGISLYLGTAIGKISIEQVIPMLIRFILVMILACIILILFPSISLWLPGLFGVS
jgi:C4-dicarboxylate transporter DctM subunit